MTGEEACVIYNVARQIGISFWAVQSILTDILGLSMVSDRWVPRILTKDQKKEQALYF